MTHPRLTLPERIKTELAGYGGTMGVWADDLRGNTVELLPDEPFETASTIKVFILAALFDAFENGGADPDFQLEYRPEFGAEGSGVFQALGTGTKLSALNAASLMIIVSDNICTNMLIGYLGLARINACIRRLGFADTVLHNPIDFTAYRRLGTTTPRDYGAAFRRIAEGTLVSEAASRQMFAILSRQKLNAMFVGGLPPYWVDPDNYGDEKLFTFASKSGSMDECRNDGGIVETPYGRYVLVMLNKNFSDKLYYPGHPAAVYGARVARLVFDQYLALEGRFKL